MFAVDWIGPDGIKPNAVPASIFIDPSSMPLDFEGRRYVPFKAGELHYALNLVTRPTYELIKSGKKFVYEISTAGASRDWAGGLAGFDHAFQHVPKTVVDAVRQDKAVILLNCTWEAHLFVEQGIFKDLTASMETMGLPFKNVWVVTSNMLAMEGASQLGNGSSKIYVVNFFEYFVRKDIEKYQESFVNEHEASQLTGRVRRFVCFNRRPHPHRQILVSELIERGLVQHGFVSMPSPRDIGYQPLPTSVNDQAAKEKIARLVEQSPLIIDSCDFSRNHAGTHIKDPYRLSWFSVVTETFFFGDHLGRMFLSEKTFKPIANYHPFIVAGLPGSLAALRSIGYMTFSPFINESYDQEQDPVRRMAMIIDEITRICSLSDSDMSVWYSSLMPVLVHNATVIRSSDTLFKFRQDIYRHLF